MALPGNIGSHGLIGGVWRKNPIVFGYSGHISEVLSDETLPTGGTILDGTPVPTGEIWVITHAAISYSGTVPIRTRIAAKHGWHVIWLMNQNAPDNAVYFSINGWWVLSATHLMRGEVIGGTLNDKLYFRYAGFKVDIDL